MTTDTSTDRYGYVAHMNWRSVVVPTGIACLVASFSAASFLMLVPAMETSDAQVLATGLDQLVKAESDSALDLNFGDSHILASLAFVALVAIGLIILSYARNDRIAYMEAFPHINLSFTKEQMAESIAVRKRCTALAVLVYLVAAGLFTLFKLFGLSHLATGCAFALGALGTWVVVHGGMRAKREDLFAYNFEALKHSSFYELNAEAKAQNREWMLMAKRHSMLAQSVDSVILTIGAFGSLALYALPSLATPYYWVAIAASGVIAMLNTHAAMEKTRRLSVIDGDVYRVAEGANDEAPERSAP